MNSLIEPASQPWTFVHGDHVYQICPIDEKYASEVLAIEERSHTTPWRASHLLSSLKNHECFGLFEQNTLCGYAFVSIFAEEAELLLFVLDLPLHGRGLAKQFLAKLLASLQANAERIFLEVRQSNLTAIAVYESCGFNQVGVRPNYYPPLKVKTPIKGANRAEDALIYAYEWLDSH